MKNNTCTTIVDFDKNSTTIETKDCKPVFVGHINLKKDIMGEWYQKMNAKLNGYTYKEPVIQFSFRYILN